MCSCPVFPAQFIEEAIFSPLYILVSFVKNKVFIGTWVYFWAFYLILLVCISVSVPVPYCLDDCSFVVQSEVRRFISPAPFFFLKCALAIQGLCVSIWIVKFFVLSVKNAIGNLIGIALNL